MKHIAQILVDHNVVKINFENPFTWASGISSPIYCDCRELMSIPEARDIIVENFLKLINEEQLPTEVISGTATAGIPWASFVAQTLNTPLLYVRSKPKGHGAGKMVEGRCEHGQHILVIEDAISTAGSSIQSTNALREELGATVEHVLAIFSWDTPQSHENAKNANVILHPLTHFEEIVETLFASGKIDDAGKASLERFHSDPEGWKN
jgi:orotate phosphoribosyltransferase